MSLVLPKFFSTIQPGLVNTHTRIAVLRCGYELNYANRLFPRPFRGAPLPLMEIHC